MPKRCELSPRTPPPTAWYPADASLPRRTHSAA
jgi:hypothetical protein